METSTRFFECLALMIFYFTTSNTLNVCQEFSNENNQYESFYCHDFCCGSCSFRYCCKNISYSLDQRFCKNNRQLTKSTTATTSTLNNSTSTNSNYQLRTTELCETYTDGNGILSLKKMCPTYSRFCCGSCKKRFCCDSNINRLNQLACKSNNSTLEKNTYLNQNYFYAFIVFLLGFVIILAFMCIPLVVLLNKKANYFCSNESIVQNLSSLSSLSVSRRIVADANPSTSTSSPAITLNGPKSCTISKFDDLPPAYNTLEFNN